ncbi:Na+ dependent nucleoside transporter [Flavobacteriales bacterium]|nr:Na+ dependent nucleoside transporter [Flavobacteriales bacterium]
MRNKLLYVVLLFTLFLSQSCSKPQASSIENQISRVWNYDTEIGSTSIDSATFLNLSKSNDEQTFVWSMNVRKDVGTWTIVDSNELVLMSPLQNTESAVDSIAQTFDDNGNTTVHYFKENETVATFNEGKFYPKQFIQKFNINKLSNTQLHLVYEDESNEKAGLTVFPFKYKSNVLPTSISFYSVTRGLIGIFGIIFITFLFSSNRKAINWSLVAKGLILQITLAVAVLYVPFVASFFDHLSAFFMKIIGYTNAGSDFVFGQFGTGTIQGPLQSFAFKILPTIIFFSALMSMLYYLGILQKIVYAFAWLMKRFMKLSGAESLAAAGNIFLGQTESPFLVRPYLEKMTKSELMCLMTGGMATIAGGVLAAYIGFLGGDDPEQSMFFAKHLLTASIMSAPAAVVAAKILVPETEEFNNEMKIPKEKLGSNILEAITNGSTDGLKLAVNVGVMLLVFTAVVYMANDILAGIGNFTGLNELIAANTGYQELSFQFLLGYAFAPIAGLMGVDNWNDMVLTGQLLGEKTILNEFYAYATFGDLKSQFLSQKSVVMATYMLCGFANFASIGIQIGGIGALIPSRKGTLSKLGVKALIGGTVASLLTAVVVGMFL